MPVFRLPFQPFNAVALPAFRKIHHAAHTREFFIITAAYGIEQIFILFFRVRFGQCRAHSDLSRGICPLETLIVPVDLGDLR